MDRRRHNNNNDPNANIKWIVGDINFDPTTLLKSIDRYLNNAIEPDYNDDFCYQSHTHNTIWYDYDIINKIITEKRSDLALQLERLNEYERMTLRHMFPDKYKEYLFDMIRHSNDRFYDLMESKCDQFRGICCSPLLCTRDILCKCTNNELDILNWNGSCTNCEHYLSILKEFNNAKMA